MVVVVVMIVVVVVLRRERLLVNGSASHRHCDGDVTGVNESGRQLLTRRRGDHVLHLVTRICGEQGRPKSYG